MKKVIVLIAELINFYLMNLHVDYKLSKAVLIPARTIGYKEGWALPTDFFCCLECTRRELIVNAIEHSSEKVTDT